MPNTVDQPDVEREPDNVTAGSSYSGAVLVDAHLFDDDRAVEPVVHFDAGRLDQHAACGFDLDRNGPDGWTTDPAKATCPKCVQPTPERRTVSLEVLTDELRETHDIFGARGPLVGIVCRVDGLAVDVPEIATLWAAPFRQPADVLSIMLRQARMYADGLDGTAGAELLMPTPDVLAALDGRDARLLTAPVHVLAMDIQAGHLLYATDDDGDGAETLELVSAVKDCTDPECIHGALCVVLAVDGHEDPDVHFNGYARIEVRIPAAVTR